MYPILLNIYGPFAINTYGTLIAIGLLVSFMLALHNKRYKKLIESLDSFAVLSWIIGGGLIGARLLYLTIEAPATAHWYEFFILWQGGWSEQGGILGVLAALALYSWCHQKTLDKKSLITVFDLIGTYAPVLHGFGRIGCFFAGCCYGAPTTSTWSIVYTNPATLAPLYVPLYPTQLYSAALFFGIFALITFVNHLWYRPGLSFALYLSLASLTRFGIDFLRDDRIYCTSSFKLIAWFSLYQWLSLVLLCSGLGIGFVVVVLAGQKKLS